MSNAADAKTIAASAVRDVIHRLALASDIGTIQEWADLMSDDVVLDLLGNVTEGREAGIAGAERRRSKGITGPDSNTRHLITTVVVDVVDDDTARSSTTALFVKLDGGVDPRIVVTYNDTYQRSGDRWLLTHRSSR